MNKLPVNGVMLDTDNVEMLASRLSAVVDRTTQQLAAARSVLGPLELDDVGIGVALADDALVSIHRGLELLRRAAEHTIVADTLHPAMVGAVGRGAHPTHFGRWAAVGGAAPTRSSASQPAHVGVDHSTSASAAVDPHRVGVGVLVRSLEELSPGGPIGPDEIRIVRIDEQRFIAVLPGVIDLTHPKLGYDPDTCSSRDLDQGALRSWRSTSVDANPYARQVVAALDVAGVPDGAEVMLIGHSYGADTALDLAADPVLNGTRVQITHVLAAGYHSEPQMSSVPATTELLVIQNSADAAVNIERAGFGVASTIERAGATLSGIGTSVEHLDDAIDHALDLARDVVSAGAHVVASVPQVASELVVDTFDHGLQGAVLEQLDATPGVFVDHEGRTRVVFEGGSEGLGHHPTNYVSFVRDSDSAEVAHFAASVAAAGYGSGGVGRAYKVAVECRQDQTPNDDSGGAEEGRR